MAIVFPWTMAILFNEAWQIYLKWNRYAKLHGNSIFTNHWKFNLNGSWQICCFFAMNIVCSVPNAIVDAIDFAIWCNIKFFHLVIYNFLQQKYNVYFYFYLPWHFTSFLPCQFLTF